MATKGNVKSKKRVAIAMAGALALTSLFAACQDRQMIDTEIGQQSYRSLEELRNESLPTRSKEFGDKQYLITSERAVLEISTEFKWAIKDYFKKYGASDWSNPDDKQFWPEDIEYVITAIAYKESSYRTNCINDRGCAGLTGLNKNDLLVSLNVWTNAPAWGSNKPYINCNPDEVDVFNGARAIEYAYYNVGYNLANFLKKDKVFIHENGNQYCIWDYVEYSDEMQLRMLIASHFFGIGNVVDSALGIHKDNIKIEQYVYSNYVENVLDKAYSMINIYEPQLGY